MTNTISNQPKPDKFKLCSLKHDLDSRSIEQTPRDLVVRQSTHPRGAISSIHKHNWTQLLYASSGLMSVNTSNGTWIIPPHRAVWIPPDILHEIKFVRATTMVNLYLCKDASIGLPETCYIIGVSPLLREIIAEVAQFPTLYEVNGSQGRLVHVLIDQLATVRETPFHLPFPQDKQLKKITNALQANPSDNSSLEQWAKIVGSSSRTLARKFRKETTMTFSEWRQQARLIAAVIQLADGISVNQVAEELGYSSQSAFTNMFRKSTGKTPARYFGGDGSPIQK